jgi:HlyD family secretion protein
MTRKILLLWLLAVLAIAAAVVLALTSRLAKGASPPLRYLTQQVDKGDITRSISASGALNPVNLVQVGTQVSGTLRAVHVDFNSSVAADQLLAEIDPGALDADLAQARAQVGSAQVAWAAARNKLARSQSLLAQGFVAQAETDDAQSSFETAQANVAQAQAAAARAQSNRKHAQIRSPVAGTVVSRDVAVGQTVAASLQTPVLFKIAQDLREMQIEANVSEADVGLIKEGQPVSFTVDAFAERRYSGTVHQIRNNYTVQQNVVTYSVLVRTRNDDLSLRPGMTAYVVVAVAQRTAVLRLPNAALRYEPTGSSPRAASHTRQVWRLKADGQAEAVPVQLGLADSRVTELASGPLREGDKLVIGEPVAGGFSAPKIF